MIATVQCEIHKLDPALPFCSTPASVLAPMMPTKALTDSFDVHKETVDMQLQMKIMAEDCDKQNKEF